MSKYTKPGQPYLFLKIIEFWRNLAQNLNEEIHDCDFFQPVEGNVSRDRVLRMIRAAYTEEDFKAMTHSENRRRRLDTDDSAKEMLAAVWNFGTSKRRFRLLVQALYDFMKGKTEKNNGKDAKKDPVETRFDELRKALKLTSQEQDVLLAAYAFRETALDYPSCGIANTERPKYYAMALNRSVEQVRDVLSPRGRLRKYNLLDEDWEFNGRLYASFLDGSSDEALTHRFFERGKTDPLPWSYYGELAETHGECLRALLTAHAKGGRCNILLYGVPGTGKTSFAHSLAREVGRTVYEIRQGDSDGRNMKAESRMAGIQMCNEQVDGADSLIVIDEADELLRGSGLLSHLGGGGSTEKGIVNTLLDGLRVPAIWISNATAREMDESVRRRFDYSVRFDRMTNAQRIAVWKNSIEKFSLGGLIPESDIPGLSAKYAASAGGIAMVLENIRNLAPEKSKVPSTIERLMRQHCQLMGTSFETGFLPAKDYSLEGLNIKRGFRLERLVECIVNHDRDLRDDAAVDKPRLNVLLWGPPGTGKTEFVKYLGARTGKRVVVKKGSDILGCFVGQTEANIRSAFREAEAEGAILFFDEIDGLLQNRSNAHQSWEVTQVNELLQQMEDFKGVMVAATNFFRNLDPAVLRRFTFKLQFDYLDETGSKLFFERTFRTKLTPDEERELSRIANLAPGDFRTVRQSFYYLGDDVTHEELLAALREEARMKPVERTAAPIGF